MKVALKKRDILIAAAGAVIAESILFSVLSHQHASHSPSLLLLFHLPGILLVDLAGIPDPQAQVAQVVIAFTGAVQLFILFLIALIIWRSIYGRRDP